MSPQSPDPTNDSSSGPRSEAAQPADPVPSAAWKRWLEKLRSHVDLATVITLAIVLVFALLWLDTRDQLNNLQQDLARKLAAADGYNQQTRASATEVSAALREVEFKLGMLESRLAETQNQRLALEALYLELSRNRDERILAEVEQILLIGSQQLQLAGNVKAALIALESADSRLQRSESSQFASLRRAIGRDIERLKSTPYVDIVGMSLRLDNLAHQVGELPLAMHERPAQPQPAAELADEGALARVAREAWQDIKTLIRVERIEREELPLITPSQTFFLRENLRLRLLSARVALLAHDEDAYKADTRSAAEWLRRYFDGKDTRVKAAIATLQRLSASEVSIDVPDISGSLEEARNQKLVRERGLR